MHVHYSTLHRGTFSSDRPRKIAYRKVFQSKTISKFARDLDYLFVAQYNYIYIVEVKQFLDDGIFAWKQKPYR